MAGRVLVLLLLAAVHDRVTCVTRSEVNEFRLNDLTDGLELMRERVVEKTGAIPKRMIELHELESRIDSLEETGCTNREIRCKTLAKNCIADILVCDGKNDCDDGSDEAHCENPAHAGVALEGDAYNVHCQAKDSPKHIRLDVLGEKRLKYFPSVVELKVHLVVDYGDGHHSDSMYDAVYYYGKRTMVVNAHEGEAIGITCHFRTDTSQYCHADFVGISTEESCGEAILIATE